MYIDTDVIMDMLGNFKMRQIITENYQSSKEPRLVEKAIRQARYIRTHTIQVHSVHLPWPVCVYYIHQGLHNI